jgi:hypothetical protein
MDFGGFHHGCQCGCLFIQGLDHTYLTTFFSEEPLVSKLLGSGIGPGEKMVTNCFKE